MEINRLSGFQCRIETLLCKSIKKGNQVSQARFMFNALLLSSLVILLRFPFVTQVHRNKFSRPRGFAGLSPCPEITFHNVGGFLFCVFLYLCGVCFVLIWF